MNDDLASEIISFKPSQDSYVQEMMSWTKANQEIFHSIRVQTKVIHFVTHKGSIKA